MTSLLLHLSFNYSCQSIKQYAKYSAGKFWLDIESLLLLREKQLKLRSCYGLQQLQLQQLRFEAVSAPTDAQQHRQSCDRTLNGFVETKSQAAVCFAQALANVCR